MDANEFVYRLQLCADGDLSIDDMEGWIDSNSWNVHKDSPSAIADAVFEFEALYSAYSDDRMSQPAVRAELHELAESLRPFAHRMQVHRYCSAPPQEETILVGVTRKPVRPETGTVVQMEFEVCV